MSKRRTNSGSNPSSNNPSNPSNPSINAQPVWELLHGNEGRRASGSGHTQYHIETAAPPRGRGREEDDISYIDEISDPFRDRSREPSFGRYYEDGDSYGYPQRGDYEALSHEAPSERVGKAGRRTPSKSRADSPASDVPPLPDPEAYSRYPGKAQRSKSAAHRPPTSRTSFRSSKSLPPLPENASELRAMSTTTREEEGDVPQRLFAGRRSDANYSMTGHIQRGGRPIPAYTQATSIAPSHAPSNADKRSAAAAGATGPMRRLAELMTGTPRNRLAALRNAAAGKKSTQGGGGTTAQWTSAPASEVTESHAGPNPPLFSLGRIKSLTKKGKEKEAEKEKEREKERSEAASRSLRNPDRERRTRRAEVASWLPTEWVPSEMGSDLNANSPSTATAKPASQPPWKDDRRSASQHHSRTDSRAKLASVDESSEALSPVIETGGSRFMSLNTPTVHRRTSSQQMSSTSTSSPVHRRRSSQQLRNSLPPLQEIPIPSTTASPLPTPISVMLEGEEHQVDDIPDIPSEADNDEHEHYSDIGYPAPVKEEKEEKEAKEAKEEQFKVPSSKSSSRKAPSEQAPPSYSTNPGSDEMPIGITTFRLPERRPTEPLTYTDEKQRLIAREEEQRRRNAAQRQPEPEPALPVVRVTSPTTKGSSGDRHRSADGGTASRPPSSALPSRSPSRISEEDEVEYEELPVPASQQALPSHVHHRSIDSTARAPSTSRKSERDVYSGRTNRASEQGHGSGGANLKHQVSNATSMMSRRSMPLRVINPTQSSTASSEVDSMPASLPQPTREKVAPRPASSMGGGSAEEDILEEDYEEEEEEERSDEEEFDRKERAPTETETATVKGAPHTRPPATESYADRSPSLPDMPMPMPNPITVYVPSPLSTPKGPKSPKLAESSKGGPMPLMLTRMLSQRDRENRLHHPKLIEWRSGPMEVQAALYGPLAEEGNDIPAEERIIWYESTGDIPEFEGFEEDVRASDLEAELGKFAYSHTYDEKGGKGVIFIPATARDINEGADGASLETFWMNFEEAKATGDMRLVELIAEYDPDAEFLVFIYLIYPDEDPRIIEVCPILSSLDVVPHMWKKRWKAGHPMASELLNQEEYYKAVNTMKASFETRRLST